MKNKCCFVLILLFVFTLSCSCLVFFGNTKEVQAQSIDFSFETTQGVALLNGGSFDLSVAAHVNESFVSDGLYAIFGVDDDTIIDIEQIEQENFDSLAATIRCLPKKAGKTTIWAATEIYAYSETEEAIIYSAKAEFSIEVVQTISSLTIEFANDSLDKANIAPGETVSATLIVNDRQNLLNSQSNWSVSLNGQDIPFELTNAYSNSIALTAAEKGTYNISAQVGEFSATVDFVVRSDAMYQFLTKWLPFLCLMLLVVLALLSLRKKRKIPLLVCKTQAETIYETAEKHLQKISNSHASPQKLERKLNRTFAMLAIVANDLYYRMYAINLDMLNQCIELVHQTDALKRVFNAVCDNKKTIPYDKKTTVMKRLTKKFLPMLIKSIDTTITAYEHALVKQDIPTDNFSLLLKSKDKRTAQKDSVEYLNQFFKMGSDDDD